MFDKIKNVELTSDNMHYICFTIAVVGILTLFLIN